MTEGLPKQEQLRQAVGEFNAHREAMVRLVALITRLTAEIKAEAND